jgi:hypothetical protein
MLPAGLWSLVEETVRQKTFTKQLAKATATFAPVFGEFVIYALSVAHIDHLCGVCVEVAAFILQRAKSCFKPTNRYEENITVLEDKENLSGSDEVVAETELLRTGCFFPGRPVVRNVRDIRLTAEPKCPKKSKKPGIYGSGTLLFWCAEHRCCIGFVVLQSAESVQHVYTAMITRFKVMPKVHVY